MSDNTVGMPVKVAHLRVFDNPELSERTPPRGDRGSLKLLVNTSFGNPNLPKAHQFAIELANVLERRTNHGTTGPSTCTAVTSWPSIAARQLAEKLLAERGIEFRVLGMQNEDGSVSVWIAYQSKAVNQ